ncbi:penicillin-binding protein 2 [Patescibacteria group bacterium]|nr:penicillin-binding protein 2 [Patescibacteria group bacterium]
MSKDPFQAGEPLDLDIDDSGHDAESWAGALRTDEHPEQVAKERKGSQSRLRFFSIALIGVLLLLAGRLIILQIANFDQNKALAEGNRIRETDVRAPRGVIYDSKQGLVAQNIPNFEVTIVPAELPRKTEERTEIYQKISDSTKKPADDIRRAAESKGLRYGQQVLVADKLDRDASVLLRIKASNLAGVQVQDNPQRQYAAPDLYSHVLGYTGRVSEDDLKRHTDFQASDYVGKTGLESVYEGDLRGTPGKRRVEVNAQGESIKELQSEDPISGHNLQLAIDPDLQKSMSLAVQNGISSSKHKATGGSAVALNPKNGEVLAMISEPSFDNNRFVNGIPNDEYQKLATDEKKPLFNRPVSGEYPPGSTFKLITSTAALAEGVVNADTYVSSPGSIDVGGSKFVDWDPKGHGSVNAAGALAVSSDVFMYKVSGGYGNQRGVGEDKLADYMRQFGLGKQTGIDLPDEHKGLVPTPSYKEKTFDEPWYIGNTYQMGIGQGYDLATPLQVATYTAAIANNGIAYKPHLVRSVENADNPANKKDIPAEPIVNLKVDSDVIKQVQEGMRKAVTSGTAVELRDFPVHVCGKTGTAEFAQETNSHAWFTAYAPCDDPQIVVTVMIEGGGEGSDVALPAVKRILDTYFKVQPKESPKPKT